MSMYYSPELVRLLTEERLREARQSNGIYCCMEPMAEKPRVQPPVPRHLQLLGSHR